jgi:hypothetical protein
MEFIIRKLMGCEEINDDAAGKANGQAQNVQRCEKYLAAEVPENHFSVVKEHKQYISRLYAMNVPF